MRYRVKSYQVSNNTILLADPALSALTIEDIRLIVNETTTNEDQQVLCSSAQKSAFVSSVTASATGATISFKQGVTIAATDQLTIELDLGDSPTASNATILEKITEVKSAVTSAETQVQTAISGIDTKIDGVSVKVDETKSAVTSAETEVKSAVSTSETNVKDKITSAQTTITQAVASSESNITSTITSAESQVKTTITTAQTSIETLENIVKEAVMGNITEFNAATAYPINTLVKYTDTSVTPNVTKVYRLNSSHDAGVTWANTSKSEVSVLSIVNEFATGYNIVKNDDGEDTYTLDLDKSAQIVDNELIIP